MPISGKERHFSPEEFIVSKTDTKGLITYANDVFLRVSDYRLDELIGKPHNLIRHSFMPRCIFKLMWAQLKAGKEIFAYVVNYTKDKDYYWVLAHVTPSFDGNGEIIGYHSNRRMPDAESIAKIKPLYQQLQRMEDEAKTPREGTELSLMHLQQWITTQGKNYDEVIHTL
jgi:PAS domain S-box-containing protein